MGCEGTFKTKSYQELTIAIKKIKHGIIINEEKIIQFLYALEQHAFSGLMNLKRYNSIQEGIENNLPPMIKITSEFIASVNN